MLGCRERTFHVEGHHYALVHCTGLEPGTTTPYEVRLDGERVWPEPDTPYPPSVDAHARAATGRSGSPGARAACARRTSRRTRCARTSTPRGARSTRCACSPTTCAATSPREWPHALVLLGDQVYADEVVARGARVHPRHARRDDPAGRDRRELRGVHAAVPRGVVGAAHPLAALDGAVGDDLRRPRRPRRLEHVQDVGRDDAGDRLVGRAHHRRLLHATGSTSTWATSSPEHLAEDELYARLRAGRGRRAAPARVRVPRRPRGGRHALELLPRLRPHAAGDDRLARRPRARPARGPLDARPGRVGVARGSTPRATSTTCCSARRCRCSCAPALHYLESWNEAVCNGAWGEPAALRRRAGAPGARPRALGGVRLLARRASSS